MFGLEVLVPEDGQPSAGEELPWVHLEPVPQLSSVDALCPSCTLLHFILDSWPKTRIYLSFLHMFLEYFLLRG